ncbi:MAG: hypothetical protein LBV79_05310 [Candidatus Adiutrix sp.]|nr:hypothetical protein [Candidatus Adiutrix sp.]
MVPTMAWGEAVPCLKGEVTYEGGAIACPACKDLATNYQLNPRFSDEVNEHMKKALVDDLESAKWLMAYFSDPAHKDYAEAKKWFGRALGIGANAADLRLPGGYDEPYMTTAYLKTDHGTVVVSSSCYDVDENWQPRCFYQYVSFFRTEIDVRRDTWSNGLWLGNKDFKENLVAINSTKIYFQDEDNYLIVLQSTGRDSNFSREDYIKNSFRYIGSNVKKENAGVQIFYPYRGKAGHKDITAEDLQRLEDLKKKATSCFAFDINLYPAKGYSGTSSRLNLQ